MHDLEALGEEYPSTWFRLRQRHAAADGREVARDAHRVDGQAAFQKRIYIDRAVEPAMERLDVFARFVAAERKFAEQIVAGERRAAEVRILTAVIPGHTPQTAFTRVFDALWRANPKSRAEGTRDVRL